MGHPQRRRAPARKTVTDTEMLVLDHDVIRRSRKARRITQRELAMLCKRSQAAVWKIETGRTDRIDEDFALSLTRWLDLDWERTFADAPASSVPKGRNVLQQPSAEAVEGIEAAS